MLTTTDHSRDKAGLTYVYPVLSRRSGGLSIGINLNVNNACNWRCIYCQVPDLVRGSAPPVNMRQLKHELKIFLADVIGGRFYQKEALPTHSQVIRDIAISGNGEPTTASEFDQVIDIIESVLQTYQLLNKVKCVLITNGSMMKRENVKTGLKKLANINGEVWFKIDSATPAGIKKINQVSGSIVDTLDRLSISATLCRTLIQTCLFAYKTHPPSAIEINAYEHLLKMIVHQGIPIKGVMLYGIERPSMQNDAGNLKKVTKKWMENFIKHMQSVPLDIKVIV